MGKSKLLTALRTEIRRLGYSYRTEQSYSNWVKRFVFFHSLTHPKKLEEPDVVEFLNHLAMERNVAASTKIKHYVPLSFYINMFLMSLLRNFKT